jgi:capsular polysaccharide biosynthesis protein
MAMASGIYLLLEELSNTDEKVTVLFSKSINDPKVNLLHMGGVTKYLVRRIKELGHSVNFIDCDYVCLNNFSLYSERANPTLSQLKKVADFLSAEVDYSKPAKEKLYLSRGKVTSFNGNRNFEIKEELWEDFNLIKKIREEKKYNFSNRIDNERAIENYFKSLGFKVIYPEDIDSFEEQLNIIASARILASITSSALVSSLVMPSGSCVVELTTKMDENIWVENVPVPSSRIHPHYKNLSDLNNHLYISIPNDKISDNLINFIEKNSSLKNFLSS